jgi:sec-independent protein translocase protein TatC
MKKVLHILTAPLRWIAVLFRWVTSPFRWLAGRGRAVRDFFVVAPEDVPITETLTTPLEGKNGWLQLWYGISEHIQALRGHLFRSLIALAITTTFSFMYAERLMQILARPIGGIENLQVIEPTEAIGVFMRVALLAGLALAMPWITGEVYMFVAPGLMPRSRIRLLIAVPAATVLFLAGIAFTYFVMLPTAMPFLANFLSFKVAWRPSAYFELVTGLMLWIGLAFQMPLIVYALASVGLIKARQLAAQWRIAVVAIAIIAATVTPTTDPINMGLVMLPMLLLYGVSIVGAAVAQSGREREVKAKAAASPG